MSHEAVHRRAPLEPAPITIPEWAAWLGSRVEDLLESELPQELVSEQAGKYLRKALRGLSLLGVDWLPDESRIAANGPWETLVRLREALAIRAANLSRRLGPWELVTPDGGLIEMVFDSTPERSAETLNRPERRKKPDTKPDTQKKFLSPKSDDIKRLGLALRRRPKSQSRIDCAREFADGDERRAQSLLRGVRRYSQYKKFAD